MAQLLELDHTAFTQDGRLNKPPKPGHSMLVLFYAPWCPHCQAILPVWDNLADTNTKHNMTMAKVDCEANALPFVQRFPTTVQYDANGTMKSVDASLIYLAEATASANKTNNTATTPTFAYFHVPTCPYCIKTTPEVLALKERLRDQCKFALVNCQANEQVARKRNVQGFPTAQIILNGNHTEMVGGATRQELLEFYQESVPLLLSCQPGAPTEE